jgi:hypothetical protein
MIDFRKEWKKPRTVMTDSRGLEQRRRINKLESSPNEDIQFLIDVIAENDFWIRALKGKLAKANPPKLGFPSDAKMADACKDWYMAGLEQAAKYVEGIRNPLEPKQIAAMLRSLIDIEEKTSVGETSVYLG